MWDPFVRFRINGIRNESNMQTAVYLWVVWFRISGDDFTISFSDGIQVSGAPLLGYSSGSHNTIADGNDLDFNDAEPLDIEFQHHFKSLSTPAGDVPATVGFIMSLNKQGSTPDGPVEFGHQKFNQLVADKLNQLIPSVIQNMGEPPSADVISQAIAQIGSEVQFWIVDDLGLIQSIGQYLSMSVDQDHVYTAFDPSNHYAGDNQDDAAIDFLVGDDIVLDGYWHVSLNWGLVAEPQWSSDW